MALPFPLLPVLIGAAVGSAVTYILTTRGIRKQLTDTLQDVGDAADDGVHEIRQRVEDVAESATDAAHKTASKIRE